MRTQVTTAIVLVVTTLLLTTGCNSIWNGWLDPTQVGRFDEDEPVTLDIQRSISVADEPLAVIEGNEPLPRDNVVIARDYVLGPGDAVEIGIMDLMVVGMEWAQNRIISEEGYITLPRIGELRAAGFSARELQRYIAQRLREEEQLLDAEVVVLPTQRRGNTYTVTGAVGNVGTYQIPRPDFRLMEALTLAGGTLPIGTTSEAIDRVFVYRREDVAIRRPVSEVDASSETSALNTASDYQPDATPGPEESDGEGPADQPPLFAGGYGYTEVAGGSVARYADDGDTENGQWEFESTTDQDNLLEQLDSAMGDEEGQPADSSDQRTDSDESATEVSAPQADDTESTTADSTDTPGTTNGNAAATRAVDQLNEDLGEWMYVDGQWIRVRREARQAPQETQPPAADTADTTATDAEDSPAPDTEPYPGDLARPSVDAAEDIVDRGPEEQVFDDLIQPVQDIRTIEIPLRLLERGDPRYDIVIRDGDRLWVPPVVSGEYYVMGNVSVPGVYSLTGSDITLKQAIAAARGLSPLADPSRCELIRRLNGDVEQIIHVDLDRIFAGKAPDYVLKPNDIINVGTNPLMPFLAVVRNAFRFTYGFGFVYDRNFADIDSFSAKANPADVARNQAVRRGLIP